LTNWYAGTLHEIPPRPDQSQQAFTGGLTGTAAATFNISVSAQGTITTPNVKILEIGLPGLDFPGILAIGPVFTINARAEADLDIVADLSLGASLDMSQMQFTFPASAGASSADIKPKDSRESRSIFPVHFSLC